MTFLVFFLTCPGFFVAVSFLALTVSRSSLSAFEPPKSSELLASEHSGCPDRTRQRRLTRFDRAATPRLSLRNSQAPAIAYIKPRPNRFSSHPFPA